jgi:glyoxylase-like metal-dependent hydrolase (beta-lactamase superfamily II)
MRVHHLNCGTMRPFGGRLVDGQSGGLGRATLVCHCLLVELDDGLVLVDTGFGVGTVTNPPSQLDPVFRGLFRPELDLARTAARQVAELGYATGDVRHIVLTHLDLDHAGGLPDFPQATVHLHAAEHGAAMARRTMSEKGRYKPAQWAHGPKWQTYEATGGERWFGFDAVRELAGLPASILLVPLHGHTRGHSGVAVQTGGRWLLHAGDAFFFHGEVEGPSRQCPPGLRLFQTITEMERRNRLGNQDRLRELVGEHAGEVDVFCAHDAAQLRRFQGAPR